MGVSVRDLLLGQQEALLVNLGTTRELLEHPTEKGDATEFDWRGTISQFLPERYRVARAQVLDSRDQMSHALDIVIFDRHYCPLWFKRGQSQFIPAESVYAVFEVKQTLKDHMAYAAEKAESVRRLYRTNLPVHNRGSVGAGSDKAAPPFRILAGVLSLESGWSPPFGNPFHDSLTAPELPAQLDMGCALRDGSFAVERERGNHGAAQGVTVSQPEGALIFFLMTLFSRLQLMGTVPAIDMSEYASVFEEPEATTTASD